MGSKQCPLTPYIHTQARTHTALPSSWTEWRIVLLLPGVAVGVVILGY